MDSSAIFSAIERFFLDIIGSVLPGFVFFAGLYYINSDCIPDIIRANYRSLGETAKITVIIAASYTIGHFLTAFGSFVDNWFSRYVDKRDTLLGLLNKKWAKNIRDKGTISPLNAVFRNFISTKLNINATDIKDNELRNLAISLVPGESQIVYRFRFLGLFNLGIEAAIMLLLWYAVCVNYSCNNWHVALYKTLGLGAVLSTIAWFFRCNYKKFTSISMRIPQDIAISWLLRNDKLNTPQPHDSHLSVYLAGGFQSRWQSIVKNCVSQVRYFDPSQTGLINSIDYTRWDLNAIRQSTIIFAYLEDSNPGGYALALEIGFAKALGKFVIFIDATNGTRYLDMLHAAADIRCRTLEEGIFALQKIIANRQEH